MQMSRRASKNNHGKYKTNAELNKFSVKNDCIEFQSNDVENFSPGTKHNYVFKLSFEEFNELVSAVAVAATAKPSEIEKLLSPIVKELSVLQATANGLYKIGVTQKS